MNKQYSGFSLIELMIVVGIIGILAGIAVPSYNAYIETSRTGVAAQNAETLAGFEDTYFYENGGYLGGTYDPGGDTTTLPNGLGWTPTDKGKFIYKVAVDNTATPPTYTITVTSVDDSSISTSLTRP